MKFIAVKNLEKFQQFKRPNPSWIKFYTAILDDYEFLALSESSQRNLLMMWLAASRSRNRLPADPRMLAQALKTTSDVNIEELLNAGFIQYTDAPPDDTKKKTRESKSQLSTIEPPSNTNSNDLVNERSYRTYSSRAGCRDLSMGG